MTMNETSSIKDNGTYNKKSQAILPLMGEIHGAKEESNNNGIEFASRAKIQKQLLGSAPSSSASNNSSRSFVKNKQIINDFIGIRDERRDCSMGLRVPRRVKDLFEELAAETRLSESEILYRMVMKCINE